MKRFFAENLSRLKLYALRIFIASIAYTILFLVFGFKGHLKDPVSFLIMMVPNLYIGLMGWKYIGARFAINKKAYWSVYWFITLSFIPGCIIEKIFGRNIVSDSLILLDSYWFTTRDYLIPVIIIMLLIKLINKKIGAKPKLFSTTAKYSHIIGIIFIILIIAYFSYGTWNAFRTVETSYTIDINKKVYGTDGINAVMVSDLHLGRVFGNEDLKRLVNAINKSKPDIVFLAGDIIDDENKPFADEHMAETLHQIESKYGTYAVLGNHDNAAGNREQNLEYLSEAGIKVLVNEYVCVADSFYVAGRSDRGEMGEQASGRIPLSLLLKDVDKKLPVILLDHQPADFKEAQQNGADIQLSGHTHAGQEIFKMPLASLYYDFLYGEYRKDNFHALVSSGFGAWGSPIRTGSHSEFVNIKIKFNCK